MPYNDDFVLPQVTDPRLEAICPGPWTEVLDNAGILRRRREDLGMTQLEVSTLAHITLRQYQRLESGERDISSATMRIGLGICRALRLDPYRFYHHAVEE